MDGFLQRFDAGALSAEFNLCEESGVVVAPLSHPGDSVTVLVPDHARLVSVHSVWAGGVLATDLLWEKHLREGLALRRCLVPVTGFHSEGEGDSWRWPGGEHAVALAGVLAWSGRFGCEVCVAPASRFQDPVPASAPLPVAPAYRVWWCRGIAKQDLIHLLEGPPWVQRIRFEPWMNRDGWVVEPDDLMIGPYPVDRDLHFHCA